MPEDPYYYELATGPFEQHPDETEKAYDNRFDQTVLDALHTLQQTHPAGAEKWCLLGSCLFYPPEPNDSHMVLDPEYAAPLADLAQKGVHFMYVFDYSTWAEYSAEDIKSLVESFVKTTSGQFLLIAFASLPWDNIRLVPSEHLLYVQTPDEDDALQTTRKLLGDLRALTSIYPGVPLARIKQLLMSTRDKQLSYSHPELCIALSKTTPLRK